MLLGLAFACVTAFLGCGGVHAAAVKAVTTPPFGRRQYSNVSILDVQEEIYFDIESQDASTSPAVLSFNFFVGSEFGNAFAPSNYDFILSYTTQNSSKAAGLVGGVPNIRTTDVSGNWNGFGSYQANKDWSSVVVNVANKQFNAYGSLTLEKSTAPPGWACGPGRGTNMASLIDSHSSPAEILALNGTNWAHLAGGIGTIDMTINGTVFKFTGPVESEHQWGPPYQNTYSRFVYGHAQIGPYDFVFYTIAPVGEPNNWFTIGYVGANSKVLFNKCSKAGQNTTGVTTVTQSGSQTVTGASFPFPSKVVVEFVEDADCRYKFEIDLPYASAANVGVGVYSELSGPVTGGKIGGMQYTSTAEVQIYAGVGNTAL